MNVSEFQKSLDESRIVAAIREGELRTSGEIRLFISRHPAVDVLSDAHRQFDRLGMHRTTLRNGVLLYFAPVSNVFAIIGDEGIHEKSGKAFWDEVKTKTEALLRGGQIEAAILQAIHTVAGELAQHFPRRSDDRNELPDTPAGD